MIGYYEDDNAVNSVEHYLGQWILRARCQHDQPAETDEQKNQINSWKRRNQEKFRVLIEKTRIKIDN